MNLHVDYSQVQNTILEIEKTMKSEELKSIDLSPREIIELSEYDVMKDSKLKAVPALRKPHDFKNIDDIVLSEIDIDSSAVSKTYTKHSIDNKMKIDNFCQNLFKYEWKNNDKK